MSSFSTSGHKHLGAPKLHPCTQAHLRRSRGTQRGWDAPQSLPPAWLKRETHVCQAYPPLPLPEREGETGRAGSNDAEQKQPGGRKMKKARLPFTGALQPKSAVLRPHHRPPALVVMTETWRGKNKGTFSVTILTIFFFQEP